MGLARYIKQEIKCPDCGGVRIRTPQWPTYSTVARCADCVRTKQKGERVDVGVKRVTCPDCQEDRTIPLRPGLNRSSSSLVRCHKCAGKLMAQKETWKQRQVVAKAEWTKRPEVKSRRMELGKE